MFQPLSPRRPGLARGLTRPLRASGLTLIELLITLAVAALLLGLTAPSFKRMIEVQRLRNINAALVTDLQFARSEAASRNQPVLIEFDSAASANGSSLTCYTVLVGASEQCDCRSSTVCGGSSTREVRTVQVQRSSGVVVQVPAGQDGRVVGFDPATGRISIYTEDIPTPPTAPFRIEVSLPGVGALRTSLEATGRPSVCSPSGQISGVPACV